VTACLPLADRREAGQRLASRLTHLAGTHPLVLALPRGGVPVAFEIAKVLGAQLDLLMVRKLGAPGNPEFAIGAVVDGADPQVVLNTEVIAAIAPGDDYIARERSIQLAELVRRRRAYMGDRHPPPLTGRTVMIVDDGIATGATMIAAIRGARKAGAVRLIVAVPVAPRDMVGQLRALCDEVIVLAVPEPFVSVGQHYRDFSQVSDQQVIRLLAAAQDSA
jgi:putative phosphoribosyl transferase